MHMQVNHRYEQILPHSSQELVVLVGQAEPVAMLLVHDYNSVIFRPKVASCVTQTGKCPSCGFLSATRQYLSHNHCFTEAETKPEMNAHYKSTQGY